MSKKGNRLSGLAKALVQNERAKELVDECAIELSAVNADVKDGLQASNVIPALEVVLEKSEVVEEKVRDVSAQLSATNDALSVQVRDRELLDRKYAATVKQEAAARHAALHDGLTGLPNRALFDDRLQHELAHAKRYGWAMAIMYMDLDEFKQVNDRYGHEVGDRVLKVVAQRLTENSRADDTISRYGGDEFLILLTRIEGAEDVAARAQTYLEVLRAPCSISSGDGGADLSIKASIGISTYPRDGDTADLLIKKADTAMYSAKRALSGYAFSG